MSRIVVALGGNALGNTPKEQEQRIKKAAAALIGLIGSENEIIVSHGNGPQVGMIHSAFDLASRQDDSIPTIDLPECTAMSQGYIGYHLQQGLKMELQRQGMPWNVATVVTQIEVYKDDPAFEHPTKPIGRFYDQATAEKIMSKDPQQRLVEDSGRGWRRVVASPKPIDIVEKDSILNLLNNEYIVIACGGGGIPVIEEQNQLVGIPAVIDKDFASAKLAELVAADCLIILTAVDQVAINFGKPEQENIGEMSVAQAKKYCEAGHFAAGSMLPKIQAAIEFVETAPGRKAIIASLEKAPLAVKGESGTLIYH
ncbi:carbamate kinase [Enterococcus sp. AZ072]|uniref:carbamate kinase n=1 Tax=unclassified Enterococcus TaxID=2608891 RepID=UPI003D27C5A8